MATANQEYFDASLRHAIDVRRFQQSLVRKMLPILEQADQDLAIQIRKLLGTLTPGVTDTIKYKRLVALMADILAARDELIRKIEGDLSDNLSEFAKLEAHVEEDMLDGAIPIAFRFATISLKTLAAIVQNDPFQGDLLSGWFNQLAAADKLRIRQAINIGVMNGETIDQIVRRLTGTRANRYQDGALSITRRNAEAVVRTAVNSVSNSAREQVWDANSDIISGVRWVSTLDGRTSAICRARDGTTYPVNSGPRPPAHWNCRSVVVAILNGIGIIGDRPFVIDDRRRPERERDFRDEAKRTGKTVQEIRSAWADKNIGQTPATVTYNDWLKGQSASFQDSVLGQAKGKLFRLGGLTMDQYVDRLGNELTLKQLKELYPEAWARVLEKQ